MFIAAAIHSGFQMEAISIGAKCRLQHQRAFAHA